MSKPVIFGLASVAAVVAADRVLASRQGAAPKVISRVCEGLESSRLV